MFKFTRPPDEYVIIRYKNGEETKGVPIHWYITTKEAYNTWYNQKVSIKINHWFDGKIYTLASSAQILVYKFGYSGEWTSVVREHLKKVNPNAWTYWHREKEWQQEAPMVKSEPTPDQYYLCKYQDGNYFICLRSTADQVKIGKPAKDCLYWDRFGSTTNWHTYSLGNPKKFPQLGSEVKAELQKQNPARYKEWEDFYMRKYPNVQPLKSVKKYDHIDPGSVYILDYANSCLYFADRYQYDNTTSKNLKCYFLSTIHGEEGIKQQYGVVSTRDSGTQKAYNFMELPQSLVNLFKGLNIDLYKQFEQYYTELKRRQRVAEKQAYDMSGKTPDMFYLYSLGYGWELVRRESIDGVVGTPDPDNTIMVVKVSDYSIREVKLKSLSQFSRLRFNDNTTPAQMETFKRQNPILFAQWKGSDLDIDKQALGESYHRSLQAIIDREGPKIGKMLIFGTGTPDEDHSGLMEMFRDPRSYNVLATPSGIDKTNWFTAGIDPYQADFETNASQSIWGRDLYGKLVNRLIELESKPEWRDFADWYASERRSIPPQEFEREVLNTAQYYGGSYIKARRVGQTTMAQQWAKLEQTLDSLPGFIQVNKQYSPNLKQQNNEIINVPRKIITVTCGQEYTGNSISSYRCPPTVAKEHTGNRPEPCRGKESSRSCKIS